MKVESADTPSTILLVDDTAINISALFRYLVSAGYRVLVAKEGKSALDTIRNTEIDLVLLDIMMPEMDGFEVCEVLKAEPQTAEIPVIFMTALTDTVDKLRGFELGAADYITKPFQHEEVVARVNMHLRLYKYKRQLEQTNQELEAFAYTVAHDLKTPLGAMLSVLDLLAEERDIPSKANQQLHWIAKVGWEMSNIIDSLLLLAGVARQQEIVLEPLDMHDIIEHVLEQRFVHLIKANDACIQLPKQWNVAKGYAPWVAEVWANYISNALKYGGHPPCLELGSERQNDGMVRFWVRDNGDGFNDKQAKQLFNPLMRLNNDDKQKGHGLGLAIVQRITQRLGGQVGVESQPGIGSLFYFTLPSV